MREPNDWRLTNQMKYLKGASLKYRAYQPKVGNDHDHCEFCFAKFMLGTSEFFRQGYLVEADDQWICEQCFADFVDLFEWKVQG